ncbi:MAG: hypothetical protein ACE15F_12885 [bacterium]
MNGLRRCLIRVLILYLLVLMPGGGLVLCRGADGHMAIEWAEEEGSCCIQSGLVRSKDQPARWSNPFGPCVCQPCRDVPLTLAAGVEASRPNLGRFHFPNGDTGGFGAVPAKQILSLIIHENPNRISSSSPFHTPFLSHLQTASLRN